MKHLNLKPNPLGIPEKDGEMQPLQGRLGYVKNIEKTVEIIAKHGNIITFAVVVDNTKQWSGNMLKLFPELKNTGGKIRIGKCFDYCIELLEEM
jgi:hypothetical protein